VALDVDFGGASSQDNINAALVGFPSLFISFGGLSSTGNEQPFTPIIVPSVPSTGNGQSGFFYGPSFGSGPVAPGFGG